MLFGRKPLAEMDRSERVRACYLHACLRHMNREFLTNASLRKRFDINAATSASAASIASRYIREAVEAGYIKPPRRAGRASQNELCALLGGERSAEVYLTSALQNGHVLAQRIE